MIKSIRLNNFRKFEEFCLDFNSNIIVIYGNNAVGKSSILEAICLVTNGYSPWSSTDNYISNNQNEDDKYTRIEISTENRSYSYFKSATRRELKIDGQKCSPKKFFNANASTIFNPEQIEILMISPSKRRDFIDDAIVVIDYEYLDNLKVFNKVLRQRNAYLKKLSKAFYERGVIARNDPMLNFWSNEFVNISNIIQKKRLSFISKIKNDDFRIEYIRSNKGVPLEECIEESKKRDIATGYTNIGPHRDDWDLINGKDIKRFGSRGEKRLSIGKLIFRIQDIVKAELGYYPTLLLDDIASELDNKNTLSIFESKDIKKQQSFITVIDYLDLPKSILKSAQLVDLNSLL